MTEHVTPSIEQFALDTCVRFAKRYECKCQAWLEENGEWHLIEESELSKHARIVLFSRLYFTVHPDGRVETHKPFNIED